MSEVPIIGKHIVREVKKVMHCMKCGHNWERNNEDRLPKVCSKCKNPQWWLPKLLGRGRPKKVRTAV